ncbi:MAG: hypothetical protein EPO07_09705 [Verrucomicrobia bacterium]|nr:MAG: hypothetical protein EPO07_09705 [Verrucomicrobiota bacterium]
MLIATALLGEITFRPRTEVSDTFGWIALSVLGAVVIFLLFFIGICLWEKQHLVGDVEPAAEPFPFKPSDYWLRTRENALRLGLHHAGDFATRKETSLVKGLQTLFLSEDARVLVSVVSGSTAGAKLKKTVLRTRLANGKILETTDNPGVSDVTGVIDRQVLLNAGVEELLRTHQERILKANCPVLAFNSTNALAEHEKIDLERGQRLMLLKLAYWVNRDETILRLNLRGAFAYVKNLFTTMSKLQDQQHRRHIKRVG